MEDVAESSLQAECTKLKEALICLHRTMEEGEKTSDVDIESMWCNVDKCRQIIQQVSSGEQEDFYSSILNQLQETLTSHAEILQTKIGQLNSKPDETSNTKTFSALRAPPADASLSSDVDMTPSGDADKEKKTAVCGENDAQKTGRRAAIMDTIVTKRGLSFSDIAGLHEAKQALQEAIIMPLQFPHLFTGGIKPWRRILLYGPPGTGKSRLAQALSSEIKSSSFYSVSSSDLVSSWVGESEKLIKELFTHATTQQTRSVIFIDEIDSICRQRSSREEEYTRRIKTELLKQMEGADNSHQADKIFLLCATNCPWELDSAFLRRFQKRIYISLPDEQARIQLMKIHTKENKLELSDDDWKALGDVTMGFSGSDLANFMLDGLIQPIRDLQKASHWEQDAETGIFVPCKDDAEGAVKVSLNALPHDKVRPRTVNLEDFLTAVHSHRRTVTEEELSKFEDFTRKLGERGS